MDPQALARRHVAAAGNVFRSAARQLDRGPLLRTIWKRVLDATERAGPRIVRTVVDQVFGRLLRGKGPAGRGKRPAFGLAGQTFFEAASARPCPRLRQSTREELRRAAGAATPHRGL